MDESGSVTDAEFDSGLDFLYQLSDAFVFDDETGMQAGSIAWASNETSNVIIPVTEDFGDPDDSGLISTGVTTDGDSKGIRELYTDKQGISSGTTLDFATNALTALIADNTDSNNDGVTNNGRRTAVPQVAVILTDANLGQLVKSGEGGGTSWINATNTMRLSGPDGISTIVMVIDDTVENAAWAYNNSETESGGDGAADDIVDAAAGGAANVFVGSTYTTIANPANSFIGNLVDQICDTAENAAALVTIKVEITNDNSGAAGINTFNVASSAGALVFDSGTTVGNTTTYTSSSIEVVAGTYSLVEDNVAGYAEGSWSCTNQSGAVVSTFNAGSVTVAAQDGNGSGGVVCTISNDDDNNTPSVANDTNAAVENGPAVTGNVLTGGVAAGDAADTLGDTPTSVTGVVDDDGDTVTIGSNFTTDEGGTLNIAANGGYTYTPPSSGVASSNDTEVFTYTITDTGGTDSDSGTLTLTVTPNSPSLSLTKAATLNDDDGTAGLSVGDTVSYTFTVTNNGNVTVSNIEVTDPTATVSGSIIASLAPGGSNNSAYTATYTVTQADIDSGSFDNTATAKGDSPSGTDDVTTTDTESTTLSGSASLSLTKTATLNDDDGTPGLSVGDTISYAFTVTNNGTLTVTNVEVTDPTATVSGSLIGSLAPGASSTSYTAIYTVTQTDIDNGNIDNTATAKGDSPSGTDDVTTTDTESTNLPEVPAIDVVKTVFSITNNGDGSIGAGDAINYQIAVTNTGNVSLSNLALADTLKNANGTFLGLTAGPTFSSATGSSTGNTLAVGESVTFVATYLMSQSDVDSGGVSNSVVASATSPHNTSVSDTSDDGDDTDGNTVDDETVILIAQFPSIAVAKTASFNDENSDGFAQSGESISYVFSIKNTGNVSLTSISVTDVLADIQLIGSVISLAPGETDSTTWSATYLLKQSDVDAGFVENQAIASGVDPDSGVVTDSSDDPATTALRDATNTSLAAIADLTVVKILATATPVYAVGEALNFDISVTNNGTQTLTSVSMSDSITDLDCPGGLPIPQLDPAATVSCTATYVIVEEDVIAGKLQNIAAASGSLPDGSTTTGQDEVVLEFGEQEADLSIDKTAVLIEDADGGGTLTPGDSIRFRISVFNEGPQPASGVKVQDQLPERYSYLSDTANGEFDEGTGIWNVGTVLVNETKTLTIDAFVRSTGHYTNIAQIVESLSADPDSDPNNDDGDQSEDDEAGSPPNPALGLAIEFGTPVALETGAYSISVNYIVENTGVVDLTSVNINEDFGSVFNDGSANNVRLVSVPVSTGGLVVNENFNGVSNTQLLDTSASGISAQSDATISMVIEVTPIPGVSEYTHNATIDALSDDPQNPTVSIPVFDISTDGPEPDVNANGNSEEDTPNIVELITAPKVGVALAASTPLPNPDGTYSTNLIITLENLGNLPLENVSIIDDLALLFPAGFELTGDPAVDLGTLVLNPAFNGSSVTELLDSDGADGITSMLGVGESATIVIPVTFNPGDQMTFNHQVAVSALGPDGEAVSQLSSNGTDPNQPPSETPLSIEPKGSLGLAQNASPAIPVIDSSTDPQDMVYTTTITLNIENLGSLDLDSVQISELLEKAFPPGTSFRILDSAISGALSELNPSFDGVTDLKLLSGNETLLIGGSAQVQLVVEFDLPDNTILETFDLVAEASGVTPSGVAVTDVSDNGTDVDANNDGIAASEGEDTPTPVSISANPIVGVVQQTIDTDGDGQVIDLVDAGDENLPLDERTLTYRTTFAIDIANMGNTDLEQLEVVNFLTSTFPSLVEKGAITIPPGGIRIVAGPNTVMINENYDGVLDANLLNSLNSSLAEGESIRIELELYIQVDYSDTAAIEELQRQNFSNQAVVNGTDPDSGIKNSDLSNDATGTDVDPNDRSELIDEIDVDGDYDPNEAGENEPTPIILPSAVQGTLWEDSDGDGQYAEGIEEALLGWSVEITDLEGNVITTIETGDDGYYSVPIVPPGPYVANFYSPTGVLSGQKRGIASSTTILDLSFPVDPRGVIYDSLTRQPINEVQLFFVNSGSGQRVDDVCLLPEQQGQITGVTLGISPGEYKFDLIPGAHDSCPLEPTQYEIEIVNLPGNYSIPSSFLMADPGVLDGSDCFIDAIPNTERCEVIDSTFAPQMGESTLHFLKFMIGEGFPNIINNHIPADPMVGAIVLLNKDTTKPRATVGEFVPYDITAENLTAFELAAVDLVDLPPQGFKYVDGSARVVRQGADGRFDTPDDIVETVVTVGERPVVLEGVRFAPNEIIRARYLLRIGSGVKRGEYTNTVEPFLGGSSIGNQSSVEVEVVADPIFDLTTLIGKVFEDVNGNGVQDEDEIGIAGARVVSVMGEWITTDEHGRYSVPGVDPGDNPRGRNVILKVDPASLPDGAIFTTENPRVMRITGGLMNRINFGVNFDTTRVQPAPLESLVERRQKVTLDDLIDPIFFRKSHSDISGEHLSQITNAIAILKDVQNLRIEVVGHTDSTPVGKPETIAKYGDNYGLSRARAEKVAETISEHLGLDMSIFDVTGLGPDQPISTDTTPDEIAKNRRAEVAIHYDKVWTETVSHQAVERAGIEIGEALFEGEVLSSEGIDAMAKLAELLSSEAYPSYVVRVKTDSSVLASKRRDSVKAFLSEHNLLTGTNHLDSVAFEKEGSTDETASIAVDRNTDGWEANGSSKVEAGSTGFFSSAAHGRDAGCLSQSFCSVDGLNLYVEPGGTVASQPNSKVGLGAAQLGNARVWVSVNPATVNPQLAVLGPDYFDSKTGDNYEFWVSTNFPEYIDSWQLEFFDFDDKRFIEPLAVHNGDSLKVGEPILWDGHLDKGSIDNLEGLYYRFTVKDSEGQKAITREYAFGRRANFDAPLDDYYDESEGEEEPASGGLISGDVSQNWLDLIGNHNDLKLMRMDISGGLVRIEADDLPEKAFLIVNGHRYPVTDKSHMTVETHLSAGKQEISVELANLEGASLGVVDIPVNIDASYFFMLALADFTFGQNEISGSTELLAHDDHYDESVFVDGRLAFFLKGKIKGEYLLTAQMDTGEDELSKIFKDLDRRDARKLFSRIDPDRFYPVYGDDSTLTRDVDTQGKFYLRMDWDQSTALWGNYNTGVSGTELASYNRGLYGAKVDYRSEESTAHGDERTLIKAFVAEPDSAAAHDEFLGTGGSLYYLNHADVVLGSAKLAVEVREQDSNRVREYIELVEGRDFDIDEFQGRIFLTRPLRSHASQQLLSIIRDEPLDGDKVFLIADYEYIPRAISGDKVTGGVRGKQWLGDSVAVGGTYVKEEKSSVDYELKAVDLTYKVSDGTYASVEFASTDSSQNIDFQTSVDGGLTFGSGNPASQAISGDAFAVNVVVDTADIGMEDLNGRVSAWYRDQDAGFDSIQYNNTDGLSKVNFGVEGRIAPGDKLGFSWRASRDENGPNVSDQAGVQISYKLSDQIDIAGEYEYRDEQSILGNQSSDTLALRLSWDVNELMSTYVVGQGSFGSAGIAEDNNSVGIGMDYQITEKIRIGGEAFGGDRGDGIRVGAEYAFNDRSAAYLNYSFEGTDTGRNSLTLGQKSDLTDKLRVYSEHRFDSRLDEKTQGQTYGIGYDFSENWTLEFDFLLGKVEQARLGYDREAYSLSSRWRNEASDLVNRLEYRINENLGSRQEQWVTANRFDYRINNDLVFVSKVDYSVTDDEVANVRSAKFGEVDFGLAYRPVHDDRFNLLAMYSYLYDLDPLTQNGGGLFDEKGHVLSLEGLYDLNNRWAIGGKFAWKKSEIRLDRNGGAFFDTSTSLYIGRARYHLVERWDALLEYRMLEVDEAGDSEQGFLMSVDYHLRDNFKVGLGYNFTDFEDNLTRLDYEAKGWFLNLTGKY
ncbi:MAG: OmpA family protein [Pseudomonadales bacterium]|nr:OmpA family protein [Pseudomonadales bacterium]